MTPWAEFNESELESVPGRVPGVFQLARGAENVAYIGRSDEDVRDELRKFLDKGYTHFQYVKMPWSKEAYEMQCRLYHHYGGRRRLDNKEHPMPPEGRYTPCLISCRPAGSCEV